MAKNQPAADQMDLPGVELDDQGKFGFAKPGGVQEKKPPKANGQAKIDDEHLPPNLAKPVKVRVPDFSNPKRPKTCLEVDFPMVPINALSALEGQRGQADLPDEQVVGAAAKLRVSGDADRRCDGSPDPQEPRRLGRAG